MTQPRLLELATPDMTSSVCLAVICGVEKKQFEAEVLYGRLSLKG